MPFSSNEYARAYYAKNRDKERARNRAWSEAHPEVKREQQVRYRNRLRAQTLAAYAALKEAQERGRSTRSDYREPAVVQRGKTAGNACACCGTTFASHLTLDHVDGGGTTDRKSSGSNWGVMRRLRRQGFPPGFQVLCWNCNWTKHNEGICLCQGEESGMETAFQKSFVAITDQLSLAVAGDRP